MLNHGQLKPSPIGRYGVVVLSILIVATSSSFLTVYISDPQYAPFSDLNFDKAPLRYGEADRIQQNAATTTLVIVKEEEGKKTRITIAAEFIMAVFAGVVSVIIAVAWSLGKIPGNIAAATILGLIGAAGIAGVARARKTRRTKTRLKK